MCLWLCWRNWESSAVIVGDTEAVDTQKRGAQITQGGQRRLPGRGRWFGALGGKRFQVGPLGLIAVELYLYTYMMLQL